MSGVIQSLTPAWRATKHRNLNDFIVALRWAKDGRLAVGLAGGGVSLMDKDLAIVAQFTHSSGLNSLSWNAKGNQLATGGQDGKVRLWDAAAGTCVGEIAPGTEWVECVEYSPIQEHLAIGAGRKVIVYDPATGASAVYPDQPSTVADIQWQPASLYFTIAAYGKLSTFQAGASEPVKEFKWKGSILKIAWSPDANFVATGNQDATVHFWYRKTGRDLEMSGYPAKVRELSWDSHSRLLATGGGPVVTIWKCDGKGPSGTRPTELKGHHGFVSALAFQRRGALLASGGRDGRLCLWEPRRNEKMLAGVELPSAVTQIAWSPDDGLLAAATEDGTVGLFEP